MAQGHYKYNTVQFVSGCARKEPYPVFMRSCELDIAIYSDRQKAKVVEIQRERRYSTIEKLPLYR